MLGLFGALLAPPPETRRVDAPPRPRPGDPGQAALCVDGCHNGVVTTEVCRSCACAHPVCPSRGFYPCADWRMAVFALVQFYKFSFDILKGRAAAVEGYW